MSANLPINGCTIEDISAEIPIAIPILYIQNQNFEENKRRNQVLSMSKEHKIHIMHNMKD